MKTLKYRGKEYEVLDIYAFEGGYTVNLNIVAAIKDETLIHALEFTATYYKEDKDVDFYYKTHIVSSRKLRLLNEFSKAQ